MPLFFRGHEIGDSNGLDQDELDLVEQGPGDEGSI